MRGFLIYSLSLFIALFSLFPQQPAFVKTAIQKKWPGCVLGVSIGGVLLFSSQSDVLNWRRCIPIGDLHVFGCLFTPATTSFLHWLVLHSALCR